MDSTTLALLISIAAVLFFLLSPGVLLTLPPSDMCSPIAQFLSGDGNCATSLPAVAVHTLIFALLFGLIAWMLLKDYEKVEKEDGTSA